MYRRTTQRSTRPYRVRDGPHLPLSKGLHHELNSKDRRSQREHCSSSRPSPRSRQPRSRPSLTGTDYLTGVADQPNRLAASALLYLIAAGTSVGIAIALYPLLKRINAALALGSVVFRTIEAVFYTAAVVSLLSIPTLGRQLATAPADDRAAIQAIADYVLSMRDHSNLVGGLRLQRRCLHVLQSCSTDHDSFPDGCRAGAWPRRS